MESNKNLYCMVYKNLIIRNGKANAFCMSLNKSYVIDNIFNWDIVYNKESNLYVLFIQGPNDSKLHEMSMKLSGEYTYDEAVKELYRYIWNHSDNWQCETFYKNVYA